MDRWDAAVVGAGAAGLLCAIRAAERGRRVILLEKNKRPGVKILISGGTRCNLTHDCDARGIMEAFGENGTWLRAALAALSPKQLIELVEAEGVPTRIEEYGKVFPASGKSQDVLGALEKRLARSGATLVCSEPLEKLERVELEGSEARAAVPRAHFRLTTRTRVLEADKVVITTGGKSYAAVGTTGDGYRWLEALGHTIVATRPALTPMTSAEPWVRPLSGLTMDDVEGRVVEAPARVLAHRRGPLLFTHFGMSGPVPMDLSKWVSGHEKPATLRLEIDLLPAESSADEWLRREATAGGKRQVSTVLGERVPKRLVEVLMSVAAVPAERKLSELSKVERAGLVKAVKGLPVALTGTQGYEKAEVTAGGVALAEVDSKTMESRKVPGLYLAGEVLDLDGWIGGYNFQGAFSTGWVAGGNL